MVKIAVLGLVTIFLTMIAGSVKREYGSIYVISSISGRQVRFSQVNWIGDQLQHDGFTCPAEKLLKAWNLTTYDELQKYLKEHYSSRTAFEDLRAFTAQL